MHSHEKVQFTPLLCKTGLHFFHWYTFNVHEVPFLTVSGPFLVPFLEKKMVPFWSLFLQGLELTSLHWWN